jgi:hypothetical protein
VSLSLWINGVNRTSHWFRPEEGTGDATFERRVGGRSPGEFILYDTVGAAGYRPVDGQSLELRDGVTPVYTGVIIDVREDALTGLDTGVKTAVTTADQQIYPELADYAVTYAAGAVTLKQILQDLVAGPLAPYGITLDPAQAAGATFSELVFDATVADILNFLQTQTGWPWRITGSLLRMVAPASEAVAFSLGDGVGSVQGTVSLKKTRGSSYANTSCSAAVRPAAASSTWGSGPAMALQRPGSSI